DLLAGHPKQVWFELGVHKDVFLKLLECLQKVGLRSSQYVTLHEQLAIFLY
ncbi:hypothetical protein K439DRAFT_1284232, partial [Ramaria rubella]